MNFFYKLESSELTVFWVEWSKLILIASMILLK